MDNPNVKSICCPSSGVHIVLPGTLKIFKFIMEKFVLNFFVCIKGYYSPQKMGLLDPDTSDGRVIFFLPWLRGTSKYLIKNAFSV